MNIFKHPSRYKKELCHYLGEPYTIRLFDLEWCVYRDFGKHDVEVSGGRCKKSPVHIYVWEKVPYIHIIERYSNLPNDPAVIKTVLDDIANRYEEAPNNDID